MDIFKKLNDDGKTILIVTHDKDVTSYCHRIVHIKDGIGK
jgi:putative ABC transport system ATP-binding protein